MSLPDQRKIKVFVIGPRGFPGVQGGIEKFSEELYPRMASLGCEVSSFAIKRFSSRKEWNGIKFIHVPSPRIKGAEKLVYNFYSAWYSIFKRPDIVHIHSIASGTFIFLLKLFRIKVVTRYNSRDYLHAKWGTFAKLLLRFSETQFFLSDYVMTNSRSYLRYLQTKSKNKNMSYIPNGIALNPPAPEPGLMKQLLETGLEPNRFVLSAGRITPEKNFETLIEAFLGSDDSFKLVIAGESADNDHYASELIRNYSKEKNILFVGKLSREQLNGLYSSAALFVLPSLFEGMPNVLLEAMSYQCPVLLSNIPAHTDFGLAPEDYFLAGDAVDLRKKMKDKLSNTKRRDYSLILVNHDWDKVARQVFTVYQKVLSE